MSKTQLLLVLIVSTLLGIFIYPTVINGYLVPDFGWMAWVALVPLLICQQRLSAGKFFWLAFFGALLGYLGALYWMIPAMNSFGGLRDVEAFGVLLLIAIILAFYLALALYLPVIIHKRLGLPLFILNAVFVVASDYLRTYVPVGGFPWPMLAYSQGNYLEFFQWVDLFGVSGLNCMLILVNGLLAEIFSPTHKERRKDLLLNRSLILVLLVSVSVLLSIYRSNRIDEWEVGTGGATVALLQGNVSQDLKWNPNLARAHIRLYSRLSEQSLASGADLVIWPETSYPYSFILNDLPSRWLIEKDSLRIPALVGAVSQNELGLVDEPIIYNSAFLMNGQSRVLDVYHKQHLVPFGEYIPMKEWLTFAKRFTVAVGDFSPGNQANVLTLNEMKMGVLMCYEDIFPDIARMFVNHGANVLINMTNDAWYGDTSAQYQHLVYSQLRALENRRYLLRATNTGITAFINHHGQVLATLKPFEEGLLLRNAPLITKKTFYSEYGDFMARGASGLCLILWPLSWFRDRKKLNREKTHGY